MLSFGSSSKASRKEDSSLRAALLSEEDDKDEEAKRLLHFLDQTTHSSKMPAATATATATSDGEDEKETENSPSTVPPAHNGTMGESGDEASPAQENKKAVDLDSARIYASNAPKILLETITARTALLVIALTYIVFIIGFAFDFVTVYRSFNSSDYELGALDCASYNASAALRDSSAFACSAGSLWNSTVTQLQNVISIKLSVQQNNVTLLWRNESAAPAELSLEYDMRIWACYNENGCGDHFAASNGYTSDANVWQHVVQLDQQRASFAPSEDLEYSSGTGYFLTYELLGNTFQNQEAIPTNGLVRAYYLEIAYANNAYGLFSGENEALQQYITYSFDVVTRPNQPVVDALTAILIFSTICLLAGYISVVRKQSFWLSEQKWLVCYFVLVIFFQNPIYVCIDWYQRTPPAGAAYASYVLNYLAQSGLFALWLLFADSMNRRENSALFFYLPKLLFGLVIFVVGIVILTMQFPGLTPAAYEEPRNAVEAVVSWTRELRYEFIAFTILYLCLILVWAITWIARLFFTGRELKRIPYMSTRYIQLSYRFFFIQAALVTFYYVFQYAAVIYFIAQGSGDSSFDSIAITDGINTLFRQQTQLFGKTLFLTVYAALLAFLFLPANFWETTSNKGLSALAATFVITEDEHRAVVKTRRSALQQMKKNLINQVTRMDQLVHAKVDVFCVDIALAMRLLSYNAYYDPPHMRTLSGYEGGMDLEAAGFTLVDSFYDASREIFCFVVKEKKTNRLAVVFRGTASKKQMEDNLNYAKKPVDFQDMPLTTLDHLDGLAVRPLPTDEDFELDSVSDTEEDLIIDDEDDDEEEARTTYDRHSGMPVASKGMLGRIVRVRESEHSPDAGTGETLMQRAGHMTDNITRALGDAVDVTNQGINKVVGATTDLVVNAASIAPGLKHILLPHVHSGFWEEYVLVRSFLHATLRRELVKNPTTVFFTGHSLGGALATFAALDISLYTIPRVNAYLKHQAKLKIIFDRSSKKGSDKAQDSSRKGILQWLPMLGRGNAAPDASRTETPGGGGGGGGIFSRTPSFFVDSHKLHLEDKVFVKKIKTATYSFGSPRVGNHAFAQLFDKLVPSTFRVVVDGDIVAGLPPGYTHVGTEILVDSLGSGSIIIDPSFVERWLRTHLKSSVAAHSLLVYRKSLLGLKLAAEYMKQCANDPTLRNVDPLRVAMRIRNNVAFEKLLDQEATSTLLHSQPVDIGRRISTTLDESSAMGIAEDKVSLSEIPADKKLAESSATNANASQVLLSIQSSADLPSEEVLAMETKHYEKDKENMEELMKQMMGNKASPMDWIKDHTIVRLKPSRAASKNNIHSPVETQDEGDVDVESA